MDLDLGVEEGEESQPLKKVFRREGVGLPGACRVTQVPVRPSQPSHPSQAAPVLKISFGKESTVLQLPPPALAVALHKVRVAPR